MMWLLTRLLTWLLTRLPTWLLTWLLRCGWLWQLTCGWFAGVHRPMARSHPPRPPWRAATPTVPSPPVLDPTCPEQGGWQASHGWHLLGVSAKTRAHSSHALAASLTHGAKRAFCSCGQLHVTASEAVSQRSASSSLQNGAENDQQMVCIRIPLPSHRDTARLHSDHEQRAHCSMPAI